MLNFPLFAPFLACRRPGGDYFGARNWFDFIMGGQADMPFWTIFWVVMPPIALLISAFAVFFIRDAKEQHTRK
jgi:hypothetical protein